MTTEAFHPRPVMGTGLGRGLGSTLTFPELFELPTTVDLATAARAFGFSMSTAYRLTSRRAFPCDVLRPTWRYRVPTAALMTALGIDQVPVSADDIEEGIAFSQRFE